MRGEEEVWWLWNVRAEWVEALCEYRAWLDERREAYQRRIQSGRTEEGENDDC